MATRRQFSREFKVEAVKLVTERGVSICIDPALSAQVRLLMRMTQQVSSCPALGEGVGGCRS